MLYLKHLLRGVKLGLFDETAAMEKFQKWHSEHEVQVKKRQDDNRKVEDTVPAEDRLLLEEWKGKLKTAQAQKDKTIQVENPGGPGFFLFFYPLLRPWFGSALTKITSHEASPQYRKIGFRIRT